MAMNKRTMARGKKMRWDIIGKEIMDPIYANLGPATRDQQDYVTEFAWGEIFARRGLPPKTRILLNLAMLTMLGEWQVLGFHIGGALRLGCSRTEIRETLIQTNTFAGFINSTFACNVAQEGFNEVDKKKRADARKKKATKGKSRSQKR